jgi:hypothetical protein
MQTKTEKKREEEKEKDRPTVYKFSILEEKLGGEERNWIYVFHMLCRSDHRIDIWADV